jgi:hypothetical protein
MTWDQLAELGVVWPTEDLQATVFDRYPRQN